MTGIFIRIKKDDGTWGAVEIDQMTDTELERWGEEGDAAYFRKFAIGLAQWIRDNIKEETA